MFTYISDQKRDYHNIPCRKWSVFAENDQQRKNHLDSNLSSIQEDFSLSAFPLFTGSFFVTLSLVAAFSVSSGIPQNPLSPTETPTLPHLQSPKDLQSPYYQ